MTGLRELTVRGARSWAEAAAQFTLPEIRSYNIAADCLRGDRSAPALIVVHGDAVAPIARGALDDGTARLAGWFAARGLQPGDRVAVKLSQSLEMATAILGALRAGLVVVPVSNVLGADGVRHRLADSGARILVGGDADEELARDAEIPLLRAAEVASIGAEPTSAPAEVAATTPRSPALLLYTSGTTGKPKGVLHGHGVVLGHHPIDAAFDFVRSTDVAYSPVDWAWAGGLFLGLLVPLAHGIPVVAYREPRFDAERTLALLDRCRVSIGLFPPTVLRLLRQAGARPRAGTLRTFITGAEAVEPELFAWAREALGVTVNNAYGLTEANALVGHSSVLGALDPNALGRPYPGRRIEIHADDGLPVAPGELGQIAIAADDPVCMLGYWNDPEATAARISGGWLRTGDTAHRDGDLVYFHGRADDIIKSGAYRIGPAEVEGVLLRDPRVAACAVVGLPDPVRGQTVTAIVQLRAGGDADEALSERLQQDVRQAIGAHAYPRKIVYVESLPKTTTGKIDRATLRRTLSAT